MNDTKIIYRVEWRPNAKKEWHHFFTGRGNAALKDATFCVNHYGSHRRLLKITTKTEVLQESVSK